MTYLRQHNQWAVVKPWTPCFFLLPIQICCPSLLLKLFFWFLMHYSSQKESVDFGLFIITTLNSVCLFHRRHSVSLQFRKVFTQTLSHTASFPFALPSPSRIWLATAEHSQSILQAFHDSFISFFFVPLCTASWVSSSDLFSKALILSSPLYNMLVWTFQNLSVLFSYCLCFHSLPSSIVEIISTHLLHNLWQVVLGLSVR